MKDLKKVFETISKEKLLSYRDEINYEIILKTKKIKSLSLISIRLEKQEIVKEYLNKIIRKKWIRINKSSIVVFLFLIFKSKIDRKRLVIDYKKLNKEIVIDSILLLLIRDIIN